jgi:hypothetical protein
MHLTLTILVTAACFFGGAFGGTSLFGDWSMAAAFFGGAVVGLAAGQLLMTCCVPARCPKCGGRTYYRGGRPITYHCRDCRHVHATSVSDRKGGWGEGA